MILLSKESKSHSSVFELKILKFYCYYVEIYCISVIDFCTQRSEIGERCSSAPDDSDGEWRTIETRTDSDGASINFR